MSRFLVIGATGQQGGSVLAALHGRGHDLSALVRDVDEPKAQDLRAKGVTLVVGDLNDQTSLEKAFQGMDAAFAMTSPFTTSTEVEAQHGVAIAEAAHASGLPYLVYSSVASADEDTGIAHFDSKYRVELRIAELGLRAAVVAPVFFMENLAFPWVTPDYARGVVRQALPPGTPLQLVSSIDIGRAVAEILERPDDFAGKRIELVGDELTGPQMAQVLGDAIGRPLRFETQPLDEVAAMGPDMKDMYAWFASTGYSGDTQRLSEVLSTVHFSTLAEWAARQDWEALLGAADG